MKFTNVPLCRLFFFFSLRISDSLSQLSYLGSSLSVAFNSSSTVVTLNSAGPTTLFLQARSAA